MKYFLLILLLSLNCLAEWKAEYSVNENSQGGQSEILDSEQAARDFLIKISKLKKGWRIGEWNEIEANALYSKIEHYTESVDTGEVYTDENGEEFPVFETIDKQRTLYYHPTNWSYNISDVTQEIADEKAKEATDKLRIDELKVKDKNDMKLDELVELLKLKGII